jgi:hypothetical protein
MISYVSLPLYYHWQCTNCCMVATVTHVTWQRICSTACDTDLADPPTPLAAGAAAWQRCDARSGREGRSAGTLNKEVGTERHAGGEHGGKEAEHLFAKAVEPEHPPDALVRGLIAMYC